MKGSIQANIRRYSMPSAGMYDLVTGLLFRGRYREIARTIAAETPPGSDVLDVSCGPGEVLVQLASIAPSLRTTGVDVDAGMIARAQRKAARFPTRRPAPDPESGPTTTAGRPQFVVADVGAMPFPDASFDLVVSSFAVHHWPDRHAGLAEVMRVLRPGGRAIIWDIASPHSVEAPPTEGGHGGPGLLGTLRMMMLFRRIPSERYDFVKPG
jgi:ubiquinone/menaquinone biosynthesis C-methylase UbiE